MAQFNPKQFIICGDRNNFYNYDGELYTATFPQKWASSHAQGSGPVECVNCRFYGCWNGVFIGYCINCANNPLYEGRRGRGMMSQGIELYNTKTKNISMYDSYFKDVNLEKVGDIWIDDTFTRVYSSIYNISIIQSFDEWLFGSMVFYDKKRELRQRPERIITITQKMNLIADAMTPTQYKDKRGKEEEEYLKYLQGCKENEMNNDSPEACMVCNLTDRQEQYYCEYHICRLGEINSRHYNIVRYDGNQITKYYI